MNGLSILAYTKFENPVKRFKQSIFVLAILISPFFGIAQNISPVNKPMNYPPTTKNDVSDTYFGTSINDPYRWLEDDRSAETKAWVEAENKVTQAYLSGIPFKETIKKRLETLWNYEKFTAPFKEGYFTYFYKNDGTESICSLPTKK
jgi:prolyl oligopeptidase